MSTPNIPEAKGKTTVFYKNGNTDDIIRVIMIGERRFESYGKEFCEWANTYFEPTKSSLKDLWKYVRKEITYKVDPAGKQLIKTPPALASIGKGDCKSKTLFVNAVLRCLDIPYKIRFVSYTNDPKPKHVYTVANLNGEQIIIDTVYRYYNKEAKPSHIKDIDMAEISLIEGIPMAQDLTAIQNKMFTASSGAPTLYEEAYYKGKEQASKEREVIKQKQAYMPKFEPIKFEKMTDGQASLQLLKRELETLMVMKPEMKRSCEKGLNMLNKAIKGNYCVTGVIDECLFKYAEKIKEARVRIRKATSFGLATKRINQLRKVAGYKCIPKNAIGNGGFRRCLNMLWYGKNPNNQQYESLLTEDQYGFCNGSTTDIFNLAGTPTATAQPSLFQYFYQYGVNTPYRATFQDFGVTAKNTINNLMANGVVHHPWGDGSYWFNSQQDYDLTLETLNQASGVTARWLDRTFENNSDGTVGSTVLYSFSDTIGASINGTVPIYNLPTQVQIKKALQDSYVNACVGFSGVSKSNVKQMASNGIMYDTGGKTPSDLLNSLWRLNTGGGSSIGEPTTIAAIVTAIVTLLSVVVKAAIAGSKTAEKRRVESGNIDQTLRDQNNMTPPGQGQTANENDWMPPRLKNDNQNGKENQNRLLLGAAAMGALYVATKDN